MSDTDYNRLLDNNITSNYRKCENGAKHKIDKETKKIAESLDLSKKMECYASRPAFITIKDHKPNFRNNIKCRLINPAKNELGLVSKKHLEKIIANVANTTKVNQWQNTTTVIDWFKLLPQKDKSRFIKFDIVEFYPSISEELLNRSISFARSITTISDSVIRGGFRTAATSKMERFVIIVNGFQPLTIITKHSILDVAAVLDPPLVINIIHHSRKSLLFDKISTWVKKGNNS